MMRMKSKYRRNQDALDWLAKQPPNSGALVSKPSQPLVTNSPPKSSNLVIGEILSPDGSVIPIKVNAKSTPALTIPRKYTDFKSWDTQAKVWRPYKYSPITSALRRASPILRYWDAAKAIIDVARFVVGYMDTSNWTKYFCRATYSFVTLETSYPVCRGESPYTVGNPNAWNGSGNPTRVYLWDEMKFLGNDPNTGVPQYSAKWTGTLLKNGTLSGAPFKGFAFPIGNMTPSWVFPKIPYRALPARLNAHDWPQARNATSYPPSDLPRTPNLFSPVKHPWSFNVNVPHPRHDTRSFIPPIIPPYPTIVKPREPAPFDTIEKKAGGKNAGYVAGILFGALDTFSEINDMVDSLYKALPKRLQTAKNFAQKYGIVLDNLEEISASEAIKNIIYNHFEDKLIGRTKNYVDKHIGKGSFSNVGRISRLHSTF